jgi:hypothetical protein
VSLSNQLADAFTMKAHQAPGKIDLLCEELSNISTGSDVQRQAHCPRAFLRFRRVNPANVENVDLHGFEKRFLHWHFCAIDRKRLPCRLDRLCDSATAI